MATLDDIWKSIEAKRVLTISGRHFLPRVKLQEIFTAESLRECIGELSIDSQDRIGLDSSILDHGTTLFAILIWMRKANTIVLFRQHATLDASLPLDVKRACEIVPEFGQTFANEVQWEFLPYTFPGNMCDSHVHIRSHAILPIIREQHFMGGIFSDITKATVHHSQQEFFNDNGHDPVIVRKQVKSKLYPEEMKCLRLLQRLQHPNVVKFLGSYSYKDLNDFLELDERPKAFADDYSFFEALHGIASALENLHVLNLSLQNHGIEVASIGYHHDLRPENVLIEGSKFLLADFGLSKIKNQKETSQTHWKAGIGDYIAPECMDKDLSHQSVGRAIDVWALGCLMSEVLTYMELGKAGVHDFRNSRSSAERLPNVEDQYFFVGNKVKSSVSRWFQQLASSSKSALVPDGVELIKEILQVDLCKRPQIGEIVQTLAVYSVRAHFIAVKQAFAQHLVFVQRSENETISFMRSWFENERLGILATVLDSSSKDSILYVLLQSQELHNRLQVLFNALLQLLHNCEKYEAIDKETETENRSSDSRQFFSVELQSLMDQLWGLFPQEYQRRMELAWREMALRTNDLEKLSNDWLRQEGLSSPQYDNFRALATMKTLRLHFLQRRTEKSSTDYRISSDDVIPLFGMDDHLVSSYKNQHVLVEWEYYSPKWDSVPKEQKAQLMALKAEGLGVTPKPPQLRILDCLGFIEKLSGKSLGYGFLYAFPTESGGELTSLLSLMEQDMRDGKMQRQPFLGQKFRLAAALVTCVHEIHTVGWLHENINSRNVVFFNAIAQQHPPLPAEVDNVSLVDFRHSRPDSRIWYTMGPSEDDYVDYQHPAYNRGDRFCRAYDYYSIGIVLLEIGLWNSLSLITKKLLTVTPEELREVLIEKYVPRLGPCMGVIYRDAVLCCLKGDFHAGNGDKDEDASELYDFRQFAEKVVEPLEDLAQLSV